MGIALGALLAGIPFVALAAASPSFDVTPLAGSTPAGTAIDITVQAKDAFGVDDPT